MDDPGFPFAPAVASGTRLLDPRAAHDPIHNRLWTVYGEAETDGPTSYGIEHNAVTAWLHLSVNKSGADFLGVSDPLDDTEWWYYTGAGGSAGNGGAAYDLTHNDYELYKGDSAHQELEFTARMPSVGFHTITGEADDRSGAVIVATNAREFPAHFTEGTNGPPLLKGMLQFLYIIPYEHDGGTKSILDGDRPDEEDITVVRPFEISPEPLVADTSVHGWVVQAPYEQVENATFIISTPNPNSAEGNPLEHIRLKGLFYDDTAPSGREWTLQQRVTPGATPVLNDIDVDASLEYRWTNATGNIPSPLRIPATPDTTSPWMGPKAQGTYFHSAVLAIDAEENAFRIFAVHAVLPESTSDDRWVVQWYVIDPDLAQFHSTTHGVWEPDIIAQGRLEDEGHSYHPVIVVNRQGQAFIEYTYSDAADPMNDDTWPEVRRVRLNSSYTAVVGSPSLVRIGPPLPYVEDASPTAVLGNWANTADAQADPFNKCAYWSTHTLVHDPGEPLPDDTEARDAWLFHQAYGGTVGPLCFQTTAMLDLNDDDRVDAYDLAAFADLYAKGARRVDLSGDGVVDAIDMALYLDAYDAYTSK